MAGSPMPNRTRIADRPRPESETTAPSIATIRVAAAGPNNSAAVKMKPSDTEMLACMEGMRMQRAPTQKGKAGEHVHVAGGGCTTSVHAAHPSGSMPSEPTASA